MKVNMTFGMEGGSEEPDNPSWGGNAMATPIYDIDIFQGFMLALGGEAVPARTVKP